VTRFSEWLQLHARRTSPIPSSHHQIERFREKTNEENGSNERQLGFGVVIIGFMVGEFKVLLQVLLRQGELRVERLDQLALRPRSTPQTILTHLQLGRLEVEEGLEEEEEEEEREMSSS